MTTDPAVRSIQIASALIDRLAELLRPQRGPDLLTALGGADVANDALALKIGEAQQISPEVWRHLDEARAELGTRGIEIGGYDELRSLQSAALLATSNIDVKRKLDTYGLLNLSVRVITVKTVTWDTANLTSAIAACALLKQALPDVDWAALEREQNAEIAAVGSLRAKRTRSILTSLGALVLLAGLAVGIRMYFLARADNAAQTKVDTAAKDDAKRKETARKNAAAKAAALAPELAAHPCDEALMRKYTAYLYAAGDAQKSDAVVDKFAADCHP